MVSNKIFYGRKSFINFIVYKDKNVKALFIMLLKMSGQAKDFDGTK